MFIHHRSQPATKRCSSVKFSTQYILAAVLVMMTTNQTSKVNGHKRETIATRLSARHGNLLQRERANGREERLMKTNESSIDRIDKLPGMITRKAAAASGKLALARNERVPLFCPSTSTMVDHNRIIMMAMLLVTNHSNIFIIVDVAVLKHRCIVFGCPKPEQAFWNRAQTWNLHNDHDHGGRTDG